MTQSYFTRILLGSEHLLAMFRYRNNHSSTNSNSNSNSNSNNHSNKPARAPLLFVFSFLKPSLAPTKVLNTYFCIGF